MKYRKIAIALCATITAAMLCGCGGGSGSGDYDGTCQFDGCSSKAVGPTYEFCSYHKKALNDYWDAQNQRNAYD